MCGLRLWEAIALQNKDIDFDNEIIFCKDNGEYIDSKQPNRHLKATLKVAKIETYIYYQLCK